MAKARPIPALAPDAAFRDAAAAAVAVRADEVFDFAEGVLDTGNIERVHDMRVATRRLRAAMEVFAPCFPRPEYKRTLREVKSLADALGRRRDPDVAIEELERVGEGLAAADRPGVQSLVAEMQEDQERGNVALAEELRTVEESGLRVRLQAMAEEARST